MARRAVPTFWRSTDQEQTWALAGNRVGGAMNAGRDGASRIGDGDAPEVALAERERLRVRGGGVVEIEEVFGEVFEETIVIFAAEALQEVRARFGDVDMALGLVIAEALARW